MTHVKEVSEILKSSFSEQDIKTKTKRELLDRMHFLDEQLEKIYKKRNYRTYYLPLSSERNKIKAELTNRNRILKYFRKNDKERLQTIREEKQRQQEEMKRKLIEEF